MQQERQHLFGMDQGESDSDGAGDDGNAQLAPLANPQASDACCAMARESLALAMFCTQTTAHTGVEKDARCMIIASSAYMLCCWHPTCCHNTGHWAARWDSRRSL